MAAIDLSRLNEAQRDVVLRLDEPLFVAAGAGSGKTFTLTARLVHALSQGSGPNGGRYLDSIDEALVITFTKAAALEIKDRVRGALRQAGEDDPFLREEALRVDGAWISTIHGMCSRILKRHGIDLGIDAKFQVCEGSVAEALLARALDEVLTDVQQDESYADLLKMFPLWGSGSNEASSVVGMIRVLQSEARKCAHGYDDLVCPRSNDAPAAMERLLNALQALAAQKLTANQAEKINLLLDAVSAWHSLPPAERTLERACEALEVAAPPTVKKKGIVELAAEVKSARDEAVLYAHYERVQHFAPQLVELAKRVDARYAKLKFERSYLDNDDLIELALRAVETNAQVAHDYEGRFKLVMIDEFQDTDEKQLRLISLLSGTNAQHLTTVGDAQQSIYRFRGGDVEVFRARGRSLPRESHVQMDVNYRSDHHVLALVERVCGDAEVLDDFLKLAGNAGRTSGYVARNEDGTVPPRAFLEVAAGGTADTMRGTLAAQIADRLAGLAAAGQPIGSMALLLGTTSSVGFYLDALRARGLQAVVTGGSSFSSTPEVGVIQALLHTLANPHDTEAGLFRLLSSDMFRLDADDFCMLGTRKQDVLDAPTKRPIERCFLDGNLELYGDTTPSPRLIAAHEVLVRAFGRLNTWEFADVCQAAIEESGWLARLEAAGTNGLSVAANVLAAVRYIRELTQSLGLGVARAADEFDQWLAVSKLTPKNLAGDNINAVRVMTIHGSKGLQFGVTAVAECWSKAKTKGRLAVGPVKGRRIVCLAPRTDSKALADARKGLEPPIEERPNMNVAEWYALVCDMQLRAEDAEKARLLYVALTRAEEALVVGLPFAEKEQYRSPLALAMLGAFEELDELEPGLRKISLEPHAGIECEFRSGDGKGGTAISRRRMEVLPGVARTVMLQRGAAKDDPWQAFSGGTLKGFDGELPESASLIPLHGTDASTGHASHGDKPFQAPDVFELFSIRRKSVVSHAWNDRNDVYSYSSLRAEELAQQRQNDRESAAYLEARYEAEAEGAGYTGDYDKATSLGSAFHALAQTMAQTNADHSPARLEALARTWNLSDRQRTRLRAAIACWESSDLRREAQAYEYRRAEVPFFTLAPASSHGTYVEGAIDLLCTHDTTCNGEALVVDYKTGDLNLTEEEVYEHHEPQARLYAEVLLRAGFSTVRCAFICVETGMVARWTFPS